MRRLRGHKGIGATGGTTGGGGGGGGGAYDPATDADLLIFADLVDPTAMYQISPDTDQLVADAGAQPVGQVNTTGSVGATFTQGTSAQKPSYDEESVNLVNFDGGDTLLATGGSAFDYVTKPVSWLVVCDPNEIGPYATFTTYATSTSYQDIRIRHDRVLARTRVSSDRLKVDQTFSQIDGPFLTQAIWEGTTLNVYVNGVFIGTDVLGIGTGLAFNNLGISCSNGVPSLWQGDFYGLIISNSAVDPVAAYNYAKSKWGIA